ncbi:DUF11 domain-containing protein [Aeoliella mucimassa]|uniref:DUF11 domain-containing protein n=1 Tax=Aeoliella mucimassa TaxID=2527972 RepID=A0A518AME2_9BACT|nr:DUF11 domain-containing protein [Aeoliella mucimassa]QDU55876.1 hypothetical protein Pan181_20730 [Aeoliella mucimassa]
MPALPSQSVMLFPRWFRVMVVAAALLVLCACQSNSTMAPHSTLADYPQAAQPYPVEQAQFASQDWVNQVPTDPYHGEVAPCSCHACQTASPAAGYACQSCPPQGGMACEPVACEPQAAVGPSDEYLCDGGDFYTPAGVGYDWQIKGLEQEDTITHYDTKDGRVIVKPSNRVCIYAPRFGAVRKVDNLLVNQSRVGPGGIIDEVALASSGRVDTATTTLEQKSPIASLGDQPANLFRGRLQAGGVQTRIGAADLENVLAPQLNLMVVRLGIIDNAEKPRLAKALVAAETWASDISAQVVVDGQKVHEQVGRTQCGEIYGLQEPDSPQIRLIKLASTGAAQLGEEVEFTLRFDNVGDQPIGNVTIVDNLATRLVYVPDSAKSTVDADFSTEPNEGGSEVLRWEITQPLKPGEGGVLRFKARVR